VLGRVWSLRERDYEDQEIFPMIMI
jgi:hypothetical protein